MPIVCKAGRARPRAPLDVFTRLANPRSADPTSHLPRPGRFSESAWVSSPVRWAFGRPCQGRNEAPCLAEFVRPQAPSWARNSRRCAAILGLIGFVLGIGRLPAADSVVVFNEIMYHPATNEAALEWVELHNQMAVDVDLSGWSMGGGINFPFAEGTVIGGGGYLVVASSPADLQAATGLTNVLGPFAGRLSNAGDSLTLRNRNQRLMDAMAYGVEGDWPVGPDGSGVSLAKRDEDTASDDAANWTVSAWTGGTPGRRNFPLQPFEVTKSTPVVISNAWKFNASGHELGTSWRDPAFEDGGWPSGQGLFRAGSALVPLGDSEPIPSAFSTGLDATGVPVIAGGADPHYWLTASAQSTPPPPALPATVIQNHPAWLANDALSGWLGPVNPGTANVNVGNYNYRTTFTLEGFEPTTASLTFSFGADNRLTDVRLNGSSRGWSYAGFSALSSAFTLTGSFLALTNTLDFLTANDGTGPNPAGFRVRLASTARRRLPSGTSLGTGPTTYYFRTRFTLQTAPPLAALRLNAVAADGAVFYLNGTEVLRLNLPEGPLSASTFALSNVPSPAYLGPWLLPNSALVFGTNVLAVEVHQAAPGSNDVLFGAALALATTNLLLPPPLNLALNEISSATNADFWIELINYGTTPLDLGGCVLARRSGATDRELVFPPQALPPGALAQVPKATLGFGADPGDRLFLYAPNRSNLLDGLVAKRAPRARWPDGTGRWWFPTTATPGASNSFAFHDEIVINEIMYDAPGLPPVPATFGTNLLLSVSNSWRYHNLGQDLGTAWRAPGYDDQGWPTGLAVFYNTPSVMPAPKNTYLPLTNSAGARLVTWYFRTPFVFTGPTNSGVLLLRPILDDGAVYYLNGVEIFRQNMPAGEIRSTNLASAGVGSPNAFTGPFSVPVTNLATGTNLLAVEVHQFTLSAIAADMAFGLEVSTVGEITPAWPYRELPEAWVELFNRSSNAVDLTGWRLGGDLEYGFAPGTMLAGGAYLVVAQDVAYLQSNYPGINMAGPFTNRLSHRSSHLLLLDSAGNPADEVRYFNDAPWPAYAAGGSSSLELRDPWADNSKPAAWAASLEGGRSSWVNCTHRAIAANLLGPTLYNELVLGLLEAGECLLDDVSVVESPAGTPVALLQNGTFETGLAAWRVLGDHNRSRVEVDPDNPANHVLHLIATGPTDHLHNHLETTFAASRALVDGREYQVSFRARWLAGNNRLNSRLYFNRVAKTFVLPRPTRHGTPGARNSTFVSNLGPTFEGLRHSPIVPGAGEPVTVSVSARAPRGIASATLWWSVNAGVWQSTPLLSNGPGDSPGYTNYAAVLGGLPAGTLVQFYAQAADGAGGSALCPPGGGNARALFKVAEGQPLLSQLHRLRLWMLPAEADFLHAHTNVMSNDRLGLTVVVDDRTVCYDAGLHLQSSERGRDASSRVGFTMRFPADQPFRGLHRSITIDRSGGQSGLGGPHDEILLWHAANHAGGLLGLENDLVQVFAPRATEDGTGLLRMADFNGTYMDGQFPSGGDGSLYKLELIYYPTTTATGDPQAPKLPQPDEVINVEIQDAGTDPENYRWVFLQENQADLDDYSRVIALNQAFSLTGTALETQTGRRLDLEAWLRTLAFKDLVGDVDTFTHGLNHNAKIFFRPDTGQSLLLLWDQDYAFVQAVNSAFPGSGSPNTYKIVTLPNNYRRYCNHLFDLITTTLNSAHLSPWAARYAGRLGQNWSGVVSYLQQRADYVRSVLPLATAFTLSNNGGRDFATTNGSVALTGTAPIALHDLLVNGTLYPLTWTSLTNWTLTVPLPAYTNLLLLRGRDNAGNLLADAIASITVTNLGQPALRSAVINEWMAENGLPGGFPDPLSGLFSDWFEVYNPNPTAVDLSGFFLSDQLAHPTQWRVPEGTILPAHGYRLFWADNATNLNALTPNGDLHVNFQLSKKGDTIALFAPDGTPVHVVSFGAQFPNVSQGLYPDGQTNAFFSMPNWTPRGSNALGSPPAPRLGGLAWRPPDTLSLTVTTLPGRTYRIECKDDLSAPGWTVLSPDHRATGELLTIIDALGGPPQRFYRVLLLP